MRVPHDPPRSGRVTRNPAPPQRLGRTQADLRLRSKSDPAKMALAARLKTETIMSIPWIAERLSLGTPKSARAHLRKRNKIESYVAML